MEKSSIVPNILNSIYFALLLNIGLRTKSQVFWGFLYNLLGVTTENIYILNYSK